MLEFSHGCSQFQAYHALKSEIILDHYPMMVNDLRQLLPEPTHHLCKPVMPWEDLQSKCMPHQFIR